jgi:hypothetical protein
MNFELSIDEVDDPVFRQVGLDVQVGLDRPILSESRFADFDDQGGGRGVNERQVSDRTLDHGEIGFEERSTPGVERFRLSHTPSWPEDETKKLTGQFG